MGGINFGWLAVWVVSPDWLGRKLEVCDFYQALRWKYPECNAHALCYFNTGAVWLFNIFPHYLIRAQFSEKKLLNTKCVLIFSTNPSGTFLILRRIKRDIIINVNRCSCKVAVTLVSTPFLDIFSQNTRITNFIRIRPVGALRMDGRTEEANSRFPQFWEWA